MTLQLPEPDRIIVPDVVRRRCAELGLAVCVVLANGSLEGGACEGLEPDVASTIGLESLAAETPAPTRVATGGWALPVKIAVARRAAACLIAVMACPGTDDSPVPPQVRSMHKMLAWMVEDAGATHQAAAEVDGFTSQLTDAYETIHTLYSVGRAMSNVISPGHFIEGLMDELADTLPFGWIACDIREDATGDDEIDAKLLVRGALSEDDDDLLVARSLAWDAVKEADHDRLLLIDNAPEHHKTLGLQLAAQTVRSSKARTAVLFAGDRRGDEAHVSSYETLLLEAAGGFLSAFLENVALYADQRETFVGTVRAITAAIDAKDQYTRGHSERVGLLARQLGEEMGMTPDECERLYLSGLVHDVGKIGVPEATLCKPGRLTDEEFDQIKRHPQIGYDILRAIPSLRPVLPGVLHHHERYDGRGYPSGLAGDQIPLLGRMLALADTFDAMSSTRAYRPAMPREKVRAEIERCAGTQFDPELVPAFLRIDFSVYDEMMTEHREASELDDPELAAA